MNGSLSDNINGGNIQPQEGVNSVYIIGHGKWLSPIKRWAPVWRPCCTACINAILKKYYNSAKMNSSYDL